MENGKAYKVTEAPNGIVGAQNGNLEASNGKLGTRGEVLCTQLTGVVWLVLGLVGGILIGVFLYHGGPNAEVTCKTPKTDHQNMMTTTQGVPTTEPPKPDDTEWRGTFTYAINNEFYEPFFNASIKLSTHRGKSLIFYMEDACRMAPDKFTKFTATFFPTVPGGAGYFIDAINGLSGNWAQNKTYWKISNQDGDLKVGVSLYVPRPGDEILFDMTQYVPTPEHEAGK